MNFQNQQNVFEAVFCKKIEIKHEGKPSNVSGYVKIFKNNLEKKYVMEYVGDSRIIEVKNIYI